MKRHPHAPAWIAPACVALVCLALAACQPDTADETSATAQASAPQTTRQTADLIPGNGDQEAAGAFDVRAFAGRFEGTLPCAGCPRVDSILDLRADGSYVLTETYPDAMEQSGSTEGNWAAEGDGAQLRLDPNNKQEPDRLYEIASNDELHQIDTGDGAIPAKVSYSLQRTDAAQ